MRLHEIKVSVSLQPVFVDKSCEDVTQHGAETDKIQAGYSKLSGNEDAASRNIGKYNLRQAERNR
jgi:hypothetical protein